MTEFDNNSQHGDSMLTLYCQEPLPAEKLHALATEAGLHFESAESCVTDEPYDFGTIFPPQEGLGDFYLHLIKNYEQWGLWPSISGDISEESVAPSEGEGMEVGEFFANQFEEDFNPEDEDHLQLLREYGFPEADEEFVDGLIANLDADEQAVQVVPAMFETLKDKAEETGIYVVSVNCPANVPSVIGWQGPVNYGFEGADISAVLRNWEDRLGAVMIGIGFCTMEIMPTRGIEEEETLERLAVEQYLFCPDVVDAEIGSFADFVKSLRNGETWSFFWD